MISREGDAFFLFFSARVQQGDAPPRVTGRVDSLLGAKKSRPRTREKKRKNKSKGGRARA